MVVDMGIVLVYRCTTSVGSVAASEPELGVDSDKVWYGHAIVHCAGLHT